MAQMTFRNVGLIDCYMGNNENILNPQSIDNNDHVYIGMIPFAYGSLIRI